MPPEPVQNFKEASQEKAFVVCARLEGYNFELDKTFWKDEGNKSLARDIYCKVCKRQLVMSHNMFAIYQKANPKPDALCMQCLGKGLEGVEK